MCKNLLSVVVPIYNEMDSLPFVIPGLVELSQEHDWQIILVNDGSTDSTKAILDEYDKITGVQVLHHRVNRGYGGALKSGISKSNTLYTVTIDADGQHDPQDIQSLLNLAECQEAELIVGSRSTNANVDFFRSIGKWLIRGVARFLMHLPIKDLNSGFKL